MATEFSQEDFTLLFDEQNNVIEIRYQGVNAELLASLAIRVDTFEDTLSTALGGSNALIGSLAVDLTSVQSLAQAISNDLADEAALRLAADELNTTNLLTFNDNAAAAILAETNARGAAILAEAAARGVAIASATGTIVTDVANLAITVNGMATELGDATASIITVEQTLSTETSARAAQYSALQADFGDTNAAILAESVVRAGETGPMATDIQALQVTVDDHTNSITTLQTVSAYGAKYGVRLNVNNHVSGFVQNNDGFTSDFIIDASTFKVFNGTSAVVPFSVTGGTVYANDLVVQNANIENLNVGKLTSGALTALITQNADWNVGTGRIIWDNGTYMKVSGVGFGSSNQFIEWFGPKLAISACTEANAIQYLKTNGSAYFGGTLSAGTLTNKVTGSSVLSTASASVGPFGTNGNTKTYTVSYTWTNFYVEQVASGGGTDSGAISATVRIDRTKGATFTSGYGTLNVSGTWSYTTDTVPNEDLPPTYRREWDESMSGSVTLTDAEVGLDDRTLAATLTARTLGVPGTVGRVQRISIVSVEE